MRKCLRPDQRVPFPHADVAHGAAEVVLQGAHIHRAVEVRPARKRRAAKRWGMGVDKTQRWWVVLVAAGNADEAAVLLRHVLKLVRHPDKVCPDLALRTKAVGSVLVDQETLAADRSVDRIRRLAARRTF